MSDAGDAPVTILLVEDNETIRDAFCILLEESGYRVLQAGTGAGALRQAETTHPQLVLLDLGLPDMEGLEVARVLSASAETCGIPVVALTGRALERDQTACLAAGCAGYLTKPIDTRHLLALIPTYLEESSGF